MTLAAGRALYFLAGPAHQLLKLRSAVFTAIFKNRHEGLPLLDELQSHSIKECRNIVRGGDAGVDHEGERQRTERLGFGVSRHGPHVAETSGFRLDAAGFWMALEAGSQGAVDTSNREQRNPRIAQVRTVHECEQLGDRSRRNER